METVKLCDRLIDDVKALKDGAPTPRACHVATINAKEAIRKLEHLQRAIDVFCEGQDWATDAWKHQEWIAPLFRLRENY
jgi:hypothetical protein